MVWVAAPASDHETKSYSLLPTVCGEGAPRVRRMPTTPVTEKGVVTGCPSSVNCMPEGTLARLKVDLIGSTSRNVVFVAPDASRTVRRMRYHTTGDVSPVFGMMKEPLRAPLRAGMNGWM